MISQTCPVLVSVYDTQVLCSNLFNKILTKYEPCSNIYYYTTTTNYHNVGFGHWENYACIYHTDKIEVNRNLEIVTIQTKYCISGYY